LRRLGTLSIRLTHLSISNKEDSMLKLRAIRFALLATTLAIIVNLALSAVTFAQDKRWRGRGNDKKSGKFINGHDALSYVAPVGQEEEFISRAVAVVSEFIAEERLTGATAA
jgi:hypothetical protein